MPTDYEKVYQQQRHALGAPTQAFVEFFEQYQGDAADVLDLGCGQGRDALHIARRGHRVVGVDLSPTGIAQLLQDAEAEGLNIEGIVADLTEYELSGDYDVIVIDRTLHMLNVGDLRRVLAQVLPITRENGFVLIADEKSNMPIIRACFDEDTHQWETLNDKKSFICLQKLPSLDDPTSTPT